MWYSESQKLKVSIFHLMSLLQILMQLEGGAILRTYHVMGLQGQESPRLDAWIRYQSPHPFLASPTHQDSGSILPLKNSKSV
jgi:hypothetical protein